MKGITASPVFLPLDSFPQRSAVGNVRTPYTGTGSLTSCTLRGIPLPGNELGRSYVSNRRHRRGGWWLRRQHGGGAPRGDHGVRRLRRRRSGLCAAAQLPTQVEVSGDLEGRRRVERLLFFRICSYFFIKVVRRRMMTAFPMRSLSKSHSCLSHRRRCGLGASRNSSSSSLRRIASNNSLLQATAGSGRHFSGTKRFGFRIS